MNYTGEITFNSHKGAWNNGNYDQTYTCGSNCLDLNPKYDCVNGFVFDIESTNGECIDIDEILFTIISNDNEAEIYIKCDIEGSEFLVLPKLLDSPYVNRIKKIYIEWHERFWHDTNEYQNKINERQTIIDRFNNMNIETFIHR